MLTDLTDAEIVARLTHVHAEASKCTFDFYWFKCPCARRIKLEHQAFHGESPALCYCGLNERFNFAAAVKRSGLTPIETEQRH